MDTLAIVGASGHGKVVAEMALTLGWRAVTFFDDDATRISEFRWPIHGAFQSLIDERERFDGVVIAIGDCRIRWRKQRQLAEAGVRMETLTHPSAVVSRSALLGAGTVVLANAVVGTDAIVGDGVIVNTAATVDHDCRLDNGVHVAPGAHLSGDVHVGTRAWIGVGACVRQGISIGADAVVGAGAVVVADVPSGAVVVGNPARLHNQNS